LFYAFNVGIDDGSHANRCPKKGDEYPARPPSRWFGAAETFQSVGLKVFVNV
jgi:hypothetical protein